MKAFRQRLLKPREKNLHGGSPWSLWSRARLRRHGSWNCRVTARRSSGAGWPLWMTAPTSTPAVPRPRPAPATTCASASPCTFAPARWGGSTGNSITRAHAFTHRQPEEKLETLNTYFPEARGELRRNRAEGVPLRYYQDAGPGKGSWESLKGDAETSATTSLT